MKKLAVVTNRALFPANGGDKRRLLFLIEAYSKFYEIEVFVVGYDLPKLEFEFFTLNNCNIKVSYFCLKKKSIFINIILGFFSLQPLQVSLYFDKKIFSLLKEELNSFDFIVGHLARSAKYLVGFESITHLDLTDAVSLKYLRSIKTRLMMPWSYLWRIFEFLTMRRYERRLVCRPFNELSVISRVDANYLNHSTDGAKITVIPNSAVLNKISSNFDSRELVFAGKLDAEANLASLSFSRHLLDSCFLEEAWTIRGCGAVTRPIPAKVKSCCTILNVNPDNYLKSLSGSFAGICLMRGSAGMQNKILDYISVGLPVICSSACADPIGLKHKESCVVVETADDLEEALLFLKEEANYYSVVSCSRDVLARYFSTSAVEAELSKRIELRLERNIR